MYPISKVLKAFLFKMISQKLQFYFFMSSLIFLFHISLLISTLTSKSISHILCIIFGSFSVLIEILFLSFYWRKLPQKPDRKTIVILLFSTASHLFINQIQAKCYRDQNNVLNFEAFLIISYCFKILPDRNIKIFLILACYVVFAFEWKLFINDLAFSLFYSLLIFVLNFHLFFLQKDNLLVKQIKKKTSLTYGKKLKEINTNKVFEKGASTIVESSFKSNFNITPMTKSAYSNLILNAIKEGIVVFDRNFQIKWQNKYLSKILTFGAPDLQNLPQKILNIKEDETFQKLQKNFLRPGKHYTQLFKAFQTKIEPLKSVHELSEKNQTPLLSCTLKPPNYNQIFKKVARSLDMLPDLNSSQLVPDRQNLFLISDNEKKSKFEFEYFLNSNSDFEIDSKSKGIENKTLKIFLQEIFRGMDNSSSLVSSSDIFSFDKYNMYGICADDVIDERKMFFIRFFPHKDEIVVMLKYMPENDLIITAMNDTSSQNRLFASMCHELRTPLNYMTNILELMHNDMKDHENEMIQNEYIDQALMNSKLLISSVNDFLDYFRVASNNFIITPNTFNVKNLLKECFGLFKFLAESKKLKYALEFDDKITQECFNDEKRIKQIVLNLLSNAFKYTESGQITLKIKKVTDLDFIQISVKDTGPGIPPSILSSLGKISSNNDSSQTTGGFGICISNHLVNFMGPDESFTETKKIYKGIKVQTQMNKGTKFAFLVNINSNNIQSNMHSICSVSLTEKGPMDSFFEKKELECKFMKLKNNDTLFSSSKSLINCNCFKVLAVDDNGFNLLILQEKFKKSDILIDIAQSGIEAIDKIKNILCHEEYPVKICKECNFYKLILMDIDMPVKNGYETTKELRILFEKYNISTPIVALSAFSQIESKGKALEAGMTDYIEKPITPENFDDLIRKYLD